MTLGLISSAGGTKYTYGLAANQPVNSSTYLTPQPNAYGTSQGSTYTQNTTHWSRTVGVTDDPAKSGIIAQQTQDTDQYKYLYFYVGSFTQTALENTAGLNASLFNAKADIDAQNFDSTGKAYLAGLAMPSDTYDNLTLGASGTTYTAPANGWVLFRSDNRPDATVRYVYFYGTGYNVRSDNTGGTAGTDIMWTAPVKKGSSFSIYHNLPAVGSGETRIFRFYYAEGAI
jgi:hypothetical protein